MKYFNVQWEKIALHLAYWESHHDIVELFCTFGTENMDKVKKVWDRHDKMFSGVAGLNLMG